jgi:hypothetical protein
MNDRVVFFSKDDMLLYDNLVRSLALIQSFPKVVFEPTPNNLLELYHIKLHADNDLYLDSWTNKDKALINTTTKEFQKLISTHFKDLDQAQIVDFFKELKQWYKPAFWTILSTTGLYKSIDLKILEELKSQKGFHWEDFLKEERLVQYFQSFIMNHINSDGRIAELLIRAHEEKMHPLYASLYFPKSLKDNDKDSIIQNYLKSDKPNINYLRLAQNPKGFTLSFRTMRDVRKKVLELEQNILKGENAKTIHYEISVSEDQEEDVLEHKDAYGLKISYSLKAIIRERNSQSILRNFLSLFEYCNNQYCINLLSKKKEASVFENHLLMTSKNDYPVNSAFGQKAFLSISQLQISMVVLEENGFSFERLLESQINDVLSQLLTNAEFKVRLPYDITDNVAKIRYLSAEIDNLLKQFQYFQENGEIDHELLIMDNKPKNLSDIKSLLSIKYAYPKGDEYKRISDLLFNQNACFQYCREFEGDSINIYKLILSRKITLHDFHDSFKQEMDFLVGFGVLSVEVETGQLRLEDMDLIHVIRYLFYEEVMNVHMHEPSAVEKLKGLERHFLVEFSGELFTRDELKYFNYYLNNKGKYSNGLELRNKYIHASHSYDDKSTSRDYLVILKMFLLMVIKIQNDLELAIKIKQTPIA